MSLYFVKNLAIFPPRFFRPLLETFRRAPVPVLRMVLLPEPRPRTHPEDWSSFLAGPRASLILFFLIQGLTSPLRRGVFSSPPFAQELRAPPCVAGAPQFSALFRRRRSSRGFISLTAFSFRILSGHAFPEATRGNSLFFIKFPSFSPLLCSSPLPTFILAK